MKRAITTLLAAAAVAVAAPAAAQKSEDTLRLALSESFPMLSPYHRAVDEGGFFFRMVYQSLIRYDEHNGKWIPELAKSWKRVSPAVLEFELRDDVVFHNGNRFDADDVVHTFEYLADPKIVLRHKEYFNWATAEKLGPYKVRITAKEPVAIDMGLIAYRYYFLDAETHKKLADPNTYGFAPNGTGHYQISDIDKNRGITATRFDGFVGDKQYERAPIKTVKGLPIPDVQTQVAQMLIGGLDVMVNLIPDTARALAKKPGIEVTNMPGGSFIYMALDSVALSGNKALADQRVREAVFSAIDRKALINSVVPGAGAAQMMDVPCFKTTIACAYTKKAPAYDPERARRLLAEAGYPNGFDMVFDAYAPIKDVAIAIAGYLRKVGIRVTVNALPITTYRKKQGQGQLQAWTVYYPLGSFPDVNSSLVTWFRGRRFDYFGKDPVIKKGMDDGLHEFDEAKRKAIYQKVLDYNADKNYVLAVSSYPLVIAHSDKVRVMTNPLSTSGVYIGDYAWK